MYFFTFKFYKFNLDYYGFQFPKKLKRTKPLEGKIKHRNL